MMADSRSLWLVTLNGVPQRLSWASVKTQDEEADSALKSHAAALRADELVGDGWDATTTAWRSVPPMLYPDVLEHASSTPTLVSRTVAVDGVEYDLDTAGRPVSLTDSGDPDATITDVDALTTLIEAMGQAVSFVEKTTLKRVRVYTSEPGSPLDGCDSAIYRQTSDSQVARVDA